MQEELLLKGIFLMKNPINQFRLLNFLFHSINQAFYLSDQYALMKKMQFFSQQKSSFYLAKGTIFEAKTI